MAYEDLKKSAPHIIAIALLVFILLILLVRFGYMRGDAVPGLCTAYYGIFGEPQIAIVGGEGAIGNPDILEDAIIQERHMFPARLSIEDVQTAGSLDPFEVVIVEGPKNISTSTLRAFGRFVQDGGRLVWVGDAGTGLGENDYICRGNPEQARPIRINYRREVTMQANNETYKECGDWETIQSGTGRDLDDPSEFEAGLCGKDYGEIVTKFIQLNHSIHQEINLCEEDGEKIYEVQNAEGILNCVEKIKQELEPGKELMQMEKGEIREKANELCGERANPWKRGPSKTPGDEILPGLDFAHRILGVDYLQKGDPKVQNLFLNPVVGDNPLTSGLIHDEVYFGTANFSKVTAERIRRNEVIFTLSKGEGERNYPAVVTFKPTAVVGPGTVVYYTFPPEIGYRPDTDWGKSVIPNMLRFLLPC